VQTLNGNLLWDPPGYIDDVAVEHVRELGGVRWIAASHPHMFGAQLEWSAAFDNAPVLVNAHDRDWIARSGDAIVPWDDEYELAPGLTLVRLGGHFPGSAVALWRGQDGAGVLLSSDTIFPVERKGWVTFLRSYPNRLPLSAGTVQRIASRVEELDFDRLYGNFPHQPITAGAKDAVLRSAERHIAWMSGEYDHLT
jgi:glyoxylase-like metal-dependent hydrolase (beta-lactamase superfamily II)